MRIVGFVEHAVIEGKLRGFAVDVTFRRMAQQLLCFFIGHGTK
jgi:hypothetical protein